MGPLLGEGLPTPPPQRSTPQEKPLPNKVATKEDAESIEHNSPGFQSGVNDSRLNRVLKGRRKDTSNSKQRFQHPFRTPPVFTVMFPRIEIRGCHV